MQQISLALAPRSSTVNYFREIIFSCLLFKFFYIFVFDNQPPNFAYQDSQVSNVISHLHLVIFLQKFNSLLKSDARTRKRLAWFNARSLAS